MPSVISARLWLPSPTSLISATGPARSHSLKAFRGLIQRFSSAPNLQHLDYARNFTVEGDASEVGLAQKTHPCCFVSVNFSTIEQRYGVGDQELLAFKWALEEWCHLLILTLPKPNSKTNSLTPSGSMTPLLQTVQLPNLIQTRLPE